MKEAWITNLSPRRICKIRHHQSHLITYLSSIFVKLRLDGGHKQIRRGEKRTVIETPFLLVTQINLQIRQIASETKK